jgi:hypothetical protein
VLDAIEQALHDRRPAHRGRLVHHSDRGSQYVSIKYTERLADAVIEPSVSSVSDSYDNALAETINGLYKAEVCASGRRLAAGVAMRRGNCLGRRGIVQRLRPHRSRLQRYFAGFISPADHRIGSARHLAERFLLSDHFI